MDYRVVIFNIQASSITAAIAEKNQYAFHLRPPHALYYNNSESLKHLLYAADREKDKAQGQESLEELACFRSKMNDQAANWPHGQRYACGNGTDSNKYCFAQLTDPYLKHTLILMPLPPYFRPQDSKELTIDFYRGYDRTKSFAVPKASKN